MENISHINNSWLLENPDMIIKKEFKISSHIAFNIPTSTLKKYDENRSTFIIDDTMICTKYSSSHNKMIT